MDLVTTFVTNVASSKSLDVSLTELIGGRPVTPPGPIKLDVALDEQQRSALQTAILRTLYCNRKFDNGKKLTIDFWEDISELFQDQGYDVKTHCHILVLLLHLVKVGAYSIRFNIINTQIKLFNSLD